MIPLFGWGLVSRAGGGWDAKMCWPMIGAPPSDGAGKADQTKGERFLNVIPGARRRRIVTTKLSAPRVDEIPISWSPTIQRSTPRLGPNTYRGLIRGSP